MFTGKAALAAYFLLERMVCLRIAMEGGSMVSRTLHMVQNMALGYGCNFLYVFCSHCA